MCRAGGELRARFDPAQGKFTRIEIDPGTNPHNVNVDHDGNAWYTGNRNGMIGRIDAKTGAITRYPMPDPESKDPRTIAFDKNTWSIWFGSDRGTIGRAGVPKGTGRPIS